MSLGYEIVRPGNLRTVVAFKDSSVIGKIIKLEQDFSNDVLSDETKRSIRNGIQQVALDIVERDLDSCSLRDLCEPETVFYRGKEWGIDVNFKGYALLEGKRGDNPRLGPHLNMKIEYYDEKEERRGEMSLQLAFTVDAPFVVLRDLLQLHSTFTGEYNLSELPDQNLIVNPKFIVNPLDKGAFFLEAARRMYQKLESSDDLYKKLLKLRRESFGEDEIAKEIKKIYAFELLEFLGVDL